MYILIITGYTGICVACHYRHWYICEKKPSHDIVFILHDHVSKLYFLRQFLANLCLVIDVCIFIALRVLRPCIL